jgi:hypothetical protein
LRRRNQDQEPELSTLDRILIRRAVKFRASVGDFVPALGRRLTEQDVAEARRVLNRPDDDPSAA